MIIEKICLIQLGSDLVKRIIFDFEENVDDIHKESKLIYSLIERKSKLYIEVARKYTTSINTRITKYKHISLNYRQQEKLYDMIKMLDNIDDKIFIQPYEDKIINYIKEIEEEYNDRNV